MQTLTVPYQGGSCQFRYYGTALNAENIVFLLTKDPEAIRLLCEDHFFVTMDLTRPGAHSFNAVKGTGAEVAFKEVIANLLVERYLLLATAGYLN